VTLLETFRGGPRKIIIEKGDTIPILMASARKNDRYGISLELLYGGDVPDDPDPLLEKIALCLSRPLEFPMHVEAIVTDEGIQDHRINLARVQIDSEIRMREDVEYHTQRLWISQTIERMVFGGLMVEGEKLGKDDEEDEDRK
jgi:hypothetical protein